MRRITRDRPDELGVRTVPITEQESALGVEHERLGGPRLKRRGPSGRHERGSGLTGSQLIASVGDSPVTGERKRRSREDDDKGAGQGHAHSTADMVGDRHPGKLHACHPGS